MTERPDTLTNPRADRVRLVRSLSGRSARRRHGQVLVEGPQSVRELVRHRPDHVRDVYLTPAAEHRHPEIARDAARSAGQLHRATADVVAAMSQDAQGVLAVARTDGLTSPWTPDSASALAAGGARLLAVLGESSDPGNAGTVVRAADAAGADAVVLGTGSVDPLAPKVLRASAGSIFHLPVLTGAPVPGALGELRAAGFLVLGADVAGEWDLDDLLDRAGGPAPADAGPQLAAPTAWLLGHEARGLSEDQRGACDALVRVPVHGLAESLNVATAATLCLYASARVHRRA